MRVRLRRRCELASESTTSGALDSVAATSMKPFVSVIQNAAGTPLPETSPSATTSVCDSGTRKSWKSPPSSRADANDAAMSTPFSRFGSCDGRSAACTRLAKCSSFSMRASDAETASYRRAFSMATAAWLASSVRISTSRLLNASSSGLSRSKTPMHRSLRSIGTASSDRTSSTTLM